MGERRGMEGVPTGMQPTYSKQPTCQTAVSHGRKTVPADAQTRMRGRPPSPIPTEVDNNPKNCSALQN